MNDPFCARRERFWDRCAALVQKLRLEVVQEAVNQARSCNAIWSPNLIAGSPVTLGHYLQNLDGRSVDLVEIARDVLREEGSPFLGLDSELLRSQLRDLPLCVIGGGESEAIFKVILETLSSLGNCWGKDRIWTTTACRIAPLLHAQLLVASFIVPWPRVEEALKEFPEANLLAREFANGLFRI